MSHVETLIMNEVRKALEQMQRTGVGYIDYETTGEISYCIDDNNITIRVSSGKDNK